MGWLYPALQGFLLSASMLVAIGPQNAFVLRQGLLRQHVFLIALFCSLSDALLIALGVGGFGKIVQASPLLLTLITWGGALFLLFYGGLALFRVFRPHVLPTAEEQQTNRLKTLTKAAAFTFLNPHVYLDTIVLLGGLSARFAGAAQEIYGLSAAIASFIWFFSLAYGARFFVPFFSKPTAWRILDLFICGVMLSLAFNLIKTALQST